MSPKNIFICYRRDDAGGYAGRLFDRLNYRFPTRVFMDVTGIRPGADFSRVIQDTVGSCHVLIAIIGRQWITLTDGVTNQRRLDLANDYVRHEIATALSRNITVIPVLVRGAEMPSSELLPPDLAPLSLRNALEITDGDFDHDAQRLVEAVEIACGEPRPIPRAAIQPRRKNSCLVFTLGAIVAVGVVVFFLVGLALLADSNQNANGGYEKTQPTAMSQSGDTAKPLFASPIQGSTSTPDLVAIHKSRLMSAIRLANYAQIDAVRTLDPARLYKVYTGEALRSHLEEIEYLKSHGLVAVLRLENQQYQSFKVSPDGLRAEVQLIETWSSTFYSASTQQCQGHIPSHQVPQTIFLERKEDVWVVDSETLDESTEPDMVPC
jgi:TIR domain